MNAVLSVQGSAVSEETKPSFLSRVFNKKKALKVAKVALPVAAVAAFFPDAAMATTTATDLMKSGDATVKGTFGKLPASSNGWFWQKLSPAASCT
jgi:hypothetical protein